MSDYDMESIETALKGILSDLDTKISLISRGKETFKADKLLAIINEVDSVILGNSNVKKAWIEGTIDVSQAITAFRTDALAKIQKSLSGRNAAETQKVTDSMTDTTKNGSEVLQADVELEKFDESKVVVANSETRYKNAEKKIANLEPKIEDAKKFDAVLKTGETKETIKQSVKDVQTGVKGAKGFKGFKGLQDIAKMAKNVVKSPSEFDYATKTDEVYKIINEHSADLSKAYTAEEIAKIEAYKAEIMKMEGKTENTDIENVISTIKDKIDIKDGKMTVKGISQLVGALRRLEMKPGREKKLKEDWEKATKTVNEKALNAQKTALSKLLTQPIFKLIDTTEWEKILKSPDVTQQQITEIMKAMNASVITFPDGRIDDMAEDADNLAKLEADLADAKKVRDAEKDNQENRDKVANEDRLREAGKKLKLFGKEFTVKENGKEISFENLKDDSEISDVIDLIEIDYNSDDVKNAYENSPGYQKPNLRQRFTGRLMHPSKSYEEVARETWAKGQMESQIKIMQARNDTAFGRLSDDELKKFRAAEQQLTQDHETKQKQAKSKAREDIIGGKSAEDAIKDNSDDER